MQKYFQAGKDRAGWYDQTRTALSGQFGADTDLVLGMLAATSINATVKSNCRLAMKAYRQHKAGQAFDGYLPVVAKNLRGLVMEGKLSGQKISAFWEALKGNPDAVVIDRWMLRAAGLRDKLTEAKTGATKGEYAKVTAMVQRLAKREGCEPRQAQAAVWFGIKDQVEKRRGVVNPAPPYQQLIQQEMRVAA